MVKSFGTCDNKEFVELHRIAIDMYFSNGSTDSSPVRTPDKSYGNELFKVVFGFWRNYTQLSLKHRQVILYGSDAAPRLEQIFGMIFFRICRF